MSGIRRWIKWILCALLPVCAIAQEPPGQQVNVSVKIVEFQTSEFKETGLSAYFRRKQEEVWGRVRDGSGAITEADFTFPKADTLGITVFLDQISGHYGDWEIVLQGLVDQGRAYILSRPKAMVMVGSKVPTKIETVETTPYEETRVFGAVAQQITSFQDTGVMLEVLALETADDDGNPETTYDNYIRLHLTAKVDEEGARIPVALDSRVTSAEGNFISVPQFNSRSITTEVWVRESQVLILGGLFLSQKTKDLKSAPWLAQGEDFISGTVQRLSPFAAPDIPVTAAAGRNKQENNRRELVFLIRADVWRPTYTVADLYGFEEEDSPSDAERRRLRPSDLITDVLEGIGELPQGIAEGLSGETDAEGVDLGGDGE